MTKRYGVWAEVWGGVTGHRYAWLRQNGEPRLFVTLEEAQREAAERTRTMMEDKWRTANFSYTAKEYV